MTYKYSKITILVIILLSLSTTFNANASTQLKDLNNQLVDLSQYKGKVIWLDFWASWCVPCRASFPWLNKIQQKYQSQGFEVIAINLDKNRSEVDRFLKHYPAQFNVLLDPEGHSAKQFKVKGMPSSYLINREGKIISSHLGFRNDEASTYENSIKQALEH